MWNRLVHGVAIASPSVTPQTSASKVRLDVFRMAANRAPCDRPIDEVVQDVLVSSADDLRRQGPESFVSEPTRHSLTGDVQLLGSLSVRKHLTAVGLGDQFVQVEL